MEGGKQSGSSFTSDLFGAKDSSSSSSVFGSIFGPPKAGVSQFEKKNDSANQSWSPKPGVSDKNAIGGEGQGQGTTSKDPSSYYQEQNVQPFHYSSSIYYGGQDVYSRPPSTQTPAFTTYNKDGDQDDSNSASRGNWWQGRNVCREAAAAASATTYP
ncbi:hypothetical protein ACJIZ3_022079 [Penstemon smallii]|uniref:Uncharacterized protein n=1 Tax=Penstemon smallii TaxID=265156 RepID=A0ABD3SNJ9_9LAMI